MKKKILENLKTKYAYLGFSTEVLEGVATNLSTFVSEETQIEPAVNGAEMMLKAFQSSADSRVGSYRNEAEKYKAELEKLKAQSSQGGQPSNKSEEIPAWAKALMESNQTLQNSLTALQKEKENQSFTSAFAQKMKEKGVPEIFYNSTLIGREFLNNEQVEAVANEVAKNYENFQKEGAKEGFSYTKPPEGGGNPKKDEDVIAQMIQQGTKEIVEQSKK